MHANIVSDIELTFGVLVRSVHIVASDDYRGQLEALVVRLNKHLSCCFACRVRVCRRQYARLHQVVVIFLHLTIHLVSRHVDEALDLGFLGTL